MKHNIQPDISELAKKGSLGILALGYKGIEMWRAGRPKIDEEKDLKKADDNEKKA